MDFAIYFSDSPPKLILLGEIYINTEAAATTVIEKAVYTVKDIRNLLGIGKNQAYALVKSGNFPAKKIGNDYRVSKVVFDKWLNTEDQKVS